MRKLIVAAILLSAAIASATTYVGARIFAGPVYILGPSDIGWTIQTHANQACNTTCTYGCVFGEDTAALTYAIVACANATADVCLCAGPS